jgi:hypothetical protein
MRICSPSPGPEGRYERKRPEPSNGSRQPEAWSKRRHSGYGLEGRGESLQQCPRLRMRGVSWRSGNVAFCATLVEN